MSAISYIVMLCLTPAAVAKEITDIAQVGPHYKIITFEKNENPQNIMVIFTRLDESCHFKPEGPKSQPPALGYYWLMDRKRYKPVHPLIRRGIEKRLVLEGGVMSESPNTSFFQIRISDLDELKTDLHEPRMRVTARKSGLDCEVETTVRLGPSDGQDTLRLTTLYSETEKKFLPPFRRLLSITLDGVNMRTGATLKRKYSIQP